MSTVIRLLCSPVLYSLRLRLYRLHPRSTGVSKEIGAASRRVEGSAFRAISLVVSEASRAGLQFSL